MTGDWKPVSEAPKDNTYMFLWSPLDGIYYGRRGVGGDEWWMSDGTRPWMPPLLFQEANVVGPTVDELEQLSA